MPPQPLSALLGWLQAALEMQIRNWQVYGDSPLIIFKKNLEIEN